MPCALQITGFDFFFCVSDFMFYLCCSAGHLCCTRLPSCCLGSILAGRHTCQPVHLSACTCGLTAAGFWHDHCSRHFSTGQPDQQEGKEVQNGSHASRVWVYGCSWLMSSHRKMRINKCYVMPQLQSSMIRRNHY